MGVEIERKFLVAADKLTYEVMHSPTVLIEQGYLNLDKARCVRVRTVTYPISEDISDKAFITIKGKAKGISRSEYEYSIPIGDALDMLELVEGDIVAKSRIRFGRWEVDIFHGHNEGLLVAEIELNSEDEIFEKPEWLGEEVSCDERFANINLAKNPYCNWEDEKSLEEKYNQAFLNHMMKKHEQICEVMRPLPERPIC